MYIDRVNWLAIHFFDKLCKLYSYASYVKVIFLVSFLHKKLPIIQKVERLKTKTWLYSHEIKNYYKHLSQSLQKLNNREYILLEN